ncbi:MAG: efflux RND transporter periplasmic adaptor subunit [Lactobacillus sp.]|jgi:membrane fusion protein (multidrug efflux system)|nr:efflux RND transporter periplasmic adaptor subunit [Lactobacillus sp.]
MFSKVKLLVLAFIPLLVISCKDDTATEQSSQPMPVYAVKATPHDVPLSFEYPARARGYKDTEVRSRVSGILLTRMYTEGSKVEEGDILFQIDPEPYKAELNNARGKLADAEAQLKAAITQWGRISKLYEERIVSEKSRDDAKAQMDSLKATVASTKAAVKSAELNLEYTTVTAPISGTTSLESNPEGSLVAVNSTLTTITQADPIYIMFSVSDSDIFSMKKMIRDNMIGAEDEEKAIARVKFDDGSIYEHDGEINFMNPTIDQTTGTVSLRAVFPNSKKLIMPQQFVRVVIEGIHMSNSITVPKEAVLQGAQGSFVYTVNKEGLVEITPIETGLTAKDGTWIVNKGLKAGDVIITTGIMKIKTGMPVAPDFGDPEEKKAAEEANKQPAKQ